jgi:UDP-N-acetylmuramoylalanine--D-glutamate ligase
MRLRDLDGRRVLVWGMRMEGTAAVALLSDAARCRPASMATVDDGTRESADIDRAEVALDGIDVIVKSPGVSRYRPEIAAFLRRGGVVTSLTDIVLSERSGRRAVGVTGTKGKSTTACLTAHLLASAGIPVELAGNIGRPPVDVLDLTDRWIVLECSSYQCADVSVSPEVGIFTSLYPEHLDWHGSADRYAADKVNLFATSEVVFVNGVQAASVEATSTLGERRRLVVPPPLLPLDELVLRGEHNHLNANLALHAAAEAAGEVHPGFATGLRTFRPLQHRLETIGTIDGWEVVDDVLATAPEAVVNSLDVFTGRPVVLLAGGYDRGISYLDFGAALAARPLVTVVAMGPAGGRIADAVEAAGGEARRVAGLDDAVAALDMTATGGGVVLLSPGATSYGEFADYRARSARFRELMRARGLIET